MPLVLGLRKGQDFYAGTDRFLVKEITGPKSFRLLRESDARLFEVDDTRAVRVSEGIHVSAGNPARDPSFVRVVVDAPPDTQILRGESCADRDHLMEHP